MLNKIRLYIGEYFLKKKSASVIRKRKVYNFSTARSFGLLFAVDSYMDCQAVQKFYEFLKSQKKEVSVIGYIDKKEHRAFKLEFEGFEYFEKKDLNWMLNPKSFIVNQFLKSEFDVLIDLDVTQNRSLQYISGLSKASLKVGRYKEENVDYFDLMINIDHQSNLEELIIQVKHYLNLINKYAS